MVHKKIRLKVPKSDQYQQKFTVDGNEFPVSPTIFQSLKYKILVSFLSSANEVSTGPTCQFLCVRLFVCVSGLFFKASNWIIYWLLTVVLATYLSE